MSDQTQYALGAARAANDYNSQPYKHETMRRDAIDRAIPVLALLSPTDLYVIVQCIKSGYLDPIRLVAGVAAPRAKMLTALSALELSFLDTDESAGVASAIAYGFETMLDVADSAASWLPGDGEGMLDLEGWMRYPFQLANSVADQVSGIDEDALARATANGIATAHVALGKILLSAQSEARNTDLSVAVAEAEAEARAILTDAGQQTATQQAESDLKSLGHSP